MYITKLNNKMNTHKSCKQFKDIFFQENLMKIFLITLEEHSDKKR